MAKEIKFDVKKKSPHANHASTLLTIRGANSNTQRLNMFASHESQFVHLVKNEYPHVFSGFEDQIGQASTNGYKKAKEDFIVLKKFQKNMYQYDLLIQYKYSKMYDIIHFRNYDHIGAISESYGTRMIEGSAIKDAVPGTEVKAGEYLSYTPCYNENGQFAYGTDLMAMYMAWDGLNHEDAIVITESGAEKLKSYKVAEVPVNIAPNAIMLDLYSSKNDTKYHGFPHVGEYTKGSTLVAFRQKNNKTLLFEFQQGRMKQLKSGDRRIVCPKDSLVVDIDVYTSKTPEELRAQGDLFICEIADELEAQNKYWTEVKEALEEIIPVATREQLESVMNENQKQLLDNEIRMFKHFIDRPLPQELNENRYTEDLGYFWKLAHEYCDPKIKWRDDGSVINNTQIKFTLLKEDPVSVGLKLTGRFGNKGVVSQIIRDDEAPCTANGRRPEIILSPYGINNRMNWAQSYEQQINFMSDHVVDLIKATDNYDEKNKLFLSYLREISHKQYFFFKNVLNSFKGDRNKLIDFYNDVETNGIYIHQYPYYGNIEAGGTIKEIADFTPFITRLKSVRKNTDKKEIYKEYLSIVDANNPEVINDEPIQFADDKANELWGDIKDMLIPISGHESDEEVKYFDYFYNEVLPDVDKKKFWEDIETNGPLLKPNLTSVILLHPEWCSKYIMEGVELPQVLGYEYFIRLKHDASNHTSMRNASNRSAKGLPLKNTTASKKLLNTYSDTPNRIGRMELNNLLITNDPKTINKLLRSYSTSTEDRETLIRALLTAANPFDVKTIINEQKSIPRAILDEYLKILDLEISDVGGENFELQE